MEKLRHMALHLFRQGSAAGLWPLGVLFQWEVRGLCAAAYCLAEPD